MNKFERKARLKAMKAKQKAAKRALRGASGQAALEAAQAPVVAAQADPAAPAPQTAQAELPSVRPPMPQSVPALSLPNGPGYGVEDAVEELSVQTTIAGNMFANAKLLGEDEAAGMLATAARTLDEVIAAAKSVLSRVSPERLQQAVELLRAEPAEATGSPQQRPRRGYDPVLTLMKLMVSAVSLLARVIYRLHPKLRKAA